MAKLICYCFQYTSEDIENDVKIHGKSLITEKIMADNKAGMCKCKTTNPKGR